MALQTPTPNLNQWLDIDLLPDFPADQKALDELTKKIEPDNLRTQLEKRPIEVKLTGMIKETQAEVRELKAPMEVLSQVAASLAECEGCEDEVAKVDEHVREVLETIEILGFRQEALADLRELLYHHDADQAPVLDRELSKRMEAKLTEWKLLSTRKKFGANKLYKEFRTAIWNAMDKQDLVMPPAKTFIAAEKGDSEDNDSSDEDIAVGGGIQVTKCPMCIKWLTDPVRSDLCNHPLCQKCFSDYLNQKQATTVGCPYTGCYSKLSEANMVLDKTLDAQIKRAKRQLARRAEREEIPYEEEETGGKDDKKPMQPLPRKGTQTQRRKIVVADSDGE